MLLSRAIRAVGLNASWVVHFSVIEEAPRNASLHYRGLYIGIFRKILHASSLRAHRRLLVTATPLPSIWHSILFQSFRNSFVPHLSMPHLLSRDPFFIHR